MHAGIHVKPVVPFPPPRFRRCVLAIQHAVLLCNAIIVLHQAIVINDMIHKPCKCWHALRSMLYTLQARARLPACAQLAC